MRRLQLLCLAPLVACGSSSDSASPGGNVSFGGAQDIGQFRGILQSGGIPGPDTLDANGFFNEHFNATPPATCGQAMCLVPGMIGGFDWVTGQKQATLVVALASPLDPTTFTRKPLDLVVVVDHSGSMAQDGRLDKVKGGLDTMIDNLDDGDRLAIVSFDDTVTTTAPLRPLDRTALHRVVDRLTPGGGTDIFDGLAAGYAQFDAQSSDHQRRVILLSDGIATVGDTATFDILQMSDQHVRTGIGLTTIGVGLDFDVELMRGLAEHGAGNFYFLENGAAADEVFAQELAFFVTPIALDLSLTAHPGAGFELGVSVGSPLWTESSDGDTMAVPAAFLASRTSQSGEPGRRGGGSAVFVDLLPNNNGNGEVASFAMHYDDAMTGMRVDQALDLVYGGDSTETPAQPYLSHPEMSERYAMYNMYRGLAAATRQDPSCARATLVALRTNAMAWNTAHVDPDLTADLALVDSYVANLDAVGATAGLDAATCTPDSAPLGRDDVRYGMACSAGGQGAGGLTVIALAGLVAVRRRRRR